ncbi:glycosyltransferase family 4 protein [Candidatus Nephthysia bennettiae]|uniref:Glycosyltransferase family 4 protein n=1 Tax=Candidatus Nephthysia bennettiae TaxID=3127016 RepID=A0A934K538_9BACT|nr:glycosyltransferase family 4 protein [Candidatus Dormibacteraeota bacterium]MBJ7611564.1 glycosyltransferase family 4 protein [Candidatus Dormibacteraeota bacterium]
MKIGLVSPYDYTHPGGVTEHIRQLGTWLRQLGHDVRTFAPSSRRDAEIDTPDFYRIGRVFSLPANDSVARITLSFHMARRVADILESERFDVLHFHEPFMPALPLTLLPMSHAPHVATFHAFAKSNLGYYYGRPILKQYLKHIDASIAVSPPARDFVQHYFPRLEPRVIPNGIDVERFRPGQTPIHHLRDNCVNVLFVGRLEKRKGLPDLLRAYEYLQQRVPRSRLIVVGDGPMRGKLDSFVSSHRLENVVMAGYVPDQVLPRYYSSADIACFPATGGESFGLVLLEAMAAGLPVVATEIPGYMSVVEAGTDSVTVRPKSPGELGLALTVLARDAMLRRRLGEAAQAKAQRFSWREVAVQVIEVYQEAREASRAAGDKEPEQSVHHSLPSVG